MNEIKLNGKTVGKTVGDKYFTSRNAKTHFYKKRQGYPISVSVLNELKSRGIKKIILRESNRSDRRILIYWCFVSDFDFVSSFKEKKYDVQKCIPLRRWNRVGDKD